MRPSSRRSLVLNGLKVQPQIQAQGPLLPQDNLRGPGLSLTHEGQRPERAARRHHTHMGGGCVARDHRTGHIEGAETEDCLRVSGGPVEVLVGLLQVSAVGEAAAYEVQP